MHNIDIFYEVQNDVEAYVTFCVYMPLSYAKDTIVLQEICYLQARVGLQYISNFVSSMYCTETFAIVIQNSKTIHYHL
jgi:hypothetical protein